MKHLLILTLILLTNNLYSQTDSCKLCLLNSQYFSEGSIVIQETVSNGEFGDYPFLCKNGEWMLFSSAKAKRPTHDGSDKIEKSILDAAITCTLCLYGNEGFSNGAILCLPYKDYPVGQLKPFICEDGKWKSKSSTPCDE